MFLVKSEAHAVPERMAPPRLPLISSNRLSLALSNLADKCGEHLINIVAVSCRGLKEGAVEFPCQLMALLY